MKKLGLRDTNEVHQLLLIDDSLRLYRDILFILDPCNPGIRECCQPIE